MNKALAVSTKHANLKYLLLFSILIISCNSPKDKPRQNTGTGQLKVIEIDNSAFVPEKEYPVHIDSLIEGLEFIPLETTKASSIGPSNRKIFFKNNRIIFLDRYHARSVIFFDRKGKYINRLKRGAAPGELHYRLIDGIINPKGNMEVMEVGSPNIKEYSLNGEFIAEKVLPELYPRLFVNVNGTYFFDKQYSGNNKNGLYNLFLYNQTKQQFVAKLFPFDKSYLEKDIYASDFSLDVYNEKVNYVMPFNDTVFTVDTDGNVKAKYHIKFTKNTLPADFLANFKGKNLLDETTKQNYPLLMQVQETDHHVIIDYNFNNTGSYTAIYDKRKEKVILNTNSARLYDDFYFSLNFQKVGKNRFVAVYPHLKYLAEYFKNNEAVSKILNRYPVRHPAMSNPVLALFSLK